MDCCHASASAENQLRRVEEATAQPSPANTPPKHPKTPDQTLYKSLNGPAPATPPQPQLDLHSMPWPSSLSLSSSLQLASCQNWSTNQPTSHSKSPAQSSPTYFLHRASPSPGPSLRPQPQTRTSHSMNPPAPSPQPKTSDVI